MAVHVFLTFLKQEIAAAEVFSLSDSTDFIKNCKTTFIY